MAWLYQLPVLHSDDLLFIFQAPDSRRAVVLYNPLAQDRTEVISLTLDSPYVTVYRYLFLFE